MRSSPHPYLRLSSYEHFGFDNEVEMLQEPIPSTPEIAYPFGLSEDVLQAILHEKWGKNKGTPSSHSFFIREEVFSYHFVVSRKNILFLFR